MPAIWKHEHLRCVEQKKGAQLKDYQIICESLGTELEK